MLIGTDLKKKACGVQRIFGIMLWNRGNLGFSKEINLMPLAAIPDGSG